MRSPPGAADRVHGHRRGERGPAPGLGADRDPPPRIPGIRIADKVLDGVIGIRLDATVTSAHSPALGTEPNFKGFGHHPFKYLS
jgi:hypothetical protein